MIREMGLRELGKLEQDLVFGDAGAKEVINFLRTKQDASTENKLRLLLIYTSVYPEKFEGDQGTKLMQLANLAPEDMKFVNNMRLLEGASGKKKTSTGNFSRKFNGAKTKQAARKDRTGEEEESWQLFRFYPVIEELLESLSKGDLPKSQYPCMNDPDSTSQVSTRSNGSVRTSKAPPPPKSTQLNTPHSMRSRRTATWARPRHSDDGYSSDSVLKNAAVADFKNMGRRISCLSLAVLLDQRF